MKAMPSHLLQSNDLNSLPYKKFEEALGSLIS